MILRNVFENPAWYTSYTPYQAEISQGRLEALFNYQTLITELTGLPVANASLLDEGTAVAEAMLLAHSQSKKKDFIVDDKIFSQTLEVLQTRAEPLGINIVRVDLDELVDLESLDNAFGVVIQYPNNHGELKYHDGFLRCAEAYKCMKIAIVDPMCQVLMKPVGDMGFDIAVGSMQRFWCSYGFLEVLMLLSLQLQISIKEKFLVEL